VGLGWWRGLPRSRFWRAVSTASQKPAATRSRSSRSFSPAGFGRGLEPRAEHSSRALQQNCWLPSVRAQAPRHLSPWPLNWTSPASRSLFCSASRFQPLRGVAKPISSCHSSPIG
jgi:hypothetical protein